MGRGLGGFKSPEAAAQYYRKYDEMVASVWPVASVEIDVPTRFGPTHVRRSGSGEGTPIVMIHPTTGSSLGWHSIIEPLAANHTVYTPDTVGTAGRSVQEVPFGSSDDLSRWLDDVLDALELDNVHLCGYSEGGWIAAVHATQSARSDRIRTLTVIEPAGAIVRVPRAFLASMVLRAMSTLRAKDRAQAVRDFSRWLNGDVELTDDDVELVELVFGKFTQKLPAPRPLSDDELRAILCPTLLMLGEDSRLHDAERVARRASALMPAVTVDVVPDAGHGLPFQYPASTASRILAFVDGPAVP